MSGSNRYDRLRETTRDDVLAHVEKINTTPGARRRGPVTALPRGRPRTGGHEAGARPPPFEGLCMA